jgi:hypothetical protein
LNLRVEVIPVSFLGKYPPRLERERFSGGVNLSAQERNRKTMSDARKAYSFTADPFKVYCAPWLLAEVRAKLQKAGAEVWP